MSVVFNKKLIIACMCIVCGIGTASGTAYADEEDLRQYAHGISYVKDPYTEKSYLIWSDAFKKGVPSDGSWTHDVYRAKINLNNPKIHGTKRIVKADEAQEPSSASYSSNGNLIVTFEDGNDAGDYELAQRFVLYGKNMKRIKKYPSDIALGGHSGHAASTEDHHVVFWSEGWVDGGGVDNLGTGDDVYVTSMDSDGDDMVTVPVAKSETTRDWWPMLASSESKSLLVWQRYVDGETYSRLCYALYDPDKGQLEKVSENSTVAVLDDLNVRYYTYNVSYLKHRGVFVVNLTTTSGEGVILLIDKSGNIIKKIRGLEAFVREAVPAISDDVYEKMYYPVNRNEVQEIIFDKDFAAKTSLHKCDFNWCESGMAGFIDNNGNIWFAALDTEHFKKGKKTVKLVKMM